MNLLYEAWRTSSGYVKASLEMGWENMKYVYFDDLNTIDTILRHFRVLQSYEGKPCTVYV
jgi:hypothetical protein